MIEAQLQRLARRACEDPTFLGWQLAAFARARSLDDEALAAHLGCAVATLASVRLCGGIRPEHFRADVMEVAAKFNLNPHRLAEAAKPLPAEPAREAGAIDARLAPGVALAARDRSQAQ